MPLRTAVAALLVSLTPLAAQIRVGVQGGVPLNDFISSQSGGGRLASSRVTSAPRRYTVGAYMEIPIHGPIGMEAGTLYKRFGFDLVASSGGFAGPFVSVRSSTTGDSWEFPITGKVRLRWAQRLNGFVTLGPSIRRLTGIHEQGERTVQTFFPPPSRTETVPFETDRPPGLDRRTSLGVVLGTGLEFQVGLLALSPGIRMTRWDSERTSSMPSASRIKRTQAEVMLGITHVVRTGPESKPATLPCCIEPGIHMGFGLLSAYETSQPPFLTTIDTPTRRFAPGAFVEWRFHPRLSLEAGFLVRRFGHTETYAQPEFIHTNVISGNSWEAPLLFKWRPLQVRGARLAVGGGPALRRASHLKWISTSNGVRIPLDASAMARPAAGVAVSGGLEFRAGPARVRPEFRYVWFQRPLYGLGYVRPRRDSAHVLLAIGWASSGRR